MSKKKISIEHEKYLKNLKRKKNYILLTQISILVIGLCLWEIAAHFKWIDTFLTSFSFPNMEIIFDIYKKGKPLLPCWNFSF